MALATQCPHCHTTFKVAHDQLKLRSGLVRCGACKQIFNGIENLVAPDKASGGAAPTAAAPEKQRQSPAAQSPMAVMPSASTISAPVAASAPASAPSVGVKTPEQASPHTASSAVQSPIDALEFIPVDDPETQTRILASEPEPARKPTADQAPASPSDDTDEDPLTRMTLVDFSLFDEDIAKAASAERTEQAAPPVRQNDEIWPDTREEAIETEEAVVATEPAEPAAPDSADQPAGTAAPLASAQEHAAADRPGVTAGASPDDTLLAAQADTKATEQPATLAGPAENTPELEEPEPEKLGPQAIPAASAEASSAIIDAQAYDEEDMAPPATVSDEDAEEPGFVTSERRRQRRRRVLGVFMAVASILLFAAMLAQAAYVFRSQLAARFPQTRPMLARLCEVAGCQVLLPAQIEQVSIESNELQAQAASKNVFTLSLLLHNRGPVAQAWPHIELTLNDKDGKALVRRALTPREYLPSDKNLADGIAARSEQAVKVSFELSQLEASDYRVYLFYP